MTNQVAFTFSPDFDHIEYAGNVIRNDDFTNTVFTERHVHGVSKKRIALVLNNETEEEKNVVKGVKSDLLPLYRESVQIKRDLVQFEKETRKKYHPLKFFFNTDIPDEALEFFDSHDKFTIAQATELFALGGFRIACDEFELLRMIKHLPGECCGDNDFYVLGQYGGKSGKFLHTTGDGNLVVVNTAGKVMQIPFSEIAAIVKTKEELYDLITHLAKFAVDKMFQRLYEYTLNVKKVLPQIDITKIPFGTPQTLFNSFKELINGSNGYPCYYLDNIELHVYALLKRKYDPDFQHMSEKEVIAHFAK